MKSLTSPARSFFLSLHTHTSRLSGLLLSLSVLASGCGPLPAEPVELEVHSQAQGLANGVTLYEHADYQGLSHRLPIGAYDAASLGIGNDTLSSIQVPSGYKVTLYEHQMFLGEQRVLTQDMNWAGDFNDRTSSVRVEFPGPFYSLAWRFAPRLRFDGSGHGYPMSAQTFYDTVVQGGSTARLENTDSSNLNSGHIPTYYQVIQCGNQVRLKYWWFYGYQAACDGVSGAHNGDWEGVVVTLSEDQSRIAAVTFSMHGKSYTRLANRGGFTVEGGTHPVVYVAKNSHAAFYQQGGSSTSCLPMEEYHNNSTGLYLDSKFNLVSLDKDTGPSDWIVADRQGGFEWGDDGISTHPTQNGPSCSMKAAEWSDGIPTWWNSQCKTGDNNDGTSCWIQCRPGYTDMGVTCTNWSINSLHTYSQSSYSFGYTLPTSDVGLLTNDYD